MKKILFFFENNWAFGSIHHALCKELYKHGIYANVLDWSQNYTSEEINFLKTIYDVFVTLPNTASTLLYTFGIEPQKIIIVAHEQTDILFTHRDHGADYFQQFLKYGVISNAIKSKSKEVGIIREPDIVNCGIHFDNFYRPIREQLKIVGYGGAKCTPNFYGLDRKRGHLVEQCVNETPDINLLNHKFYRYMCMPAYYEKIDCLIVSSYEDAGGLPAMEAAASGCLVISTPVGYFEYHGPRGGGITVPINENDFVNQTKQHLEFYKNNISAYKEKCEQIQQYARDNYDWSNKIENWVNFLT